MRISRRIILGFSVLALVGLGVYLLLRREGSSTIKSLPTYFVYTDEALKPLKDMKSQYKIQAEELWRWEDKAYEIVGKTKTDTTNASKFYAYLFTAQRDAAFLSYQSHAGKFLGSLDPVSAAVSCLFFPDFCSELSKDGKRDVYSDALANAVLTKIKERIEEDQKNTRPYEIKSGAEFWNGKAPFKGLDAGSWKPWLIPSVEPFRLPLPPKEGSPEDEEQFEIVRSIFPTLTDKQKNEIAVWAAGPGTKSSAGIWLKMASDYIKKNQTDLATVFRIRSVLAMAIADTEIAAMDSKYTYWVKRPFMRDPSILTFMPTPNHPSYPSDSTSVAGTGATLLSHYFPEAQAQWASLMQESGQSRIHSGIHFPADVEQGLALGKAIAEEIIRQDG